jgi:branched-chain amino acid transport system ATP-binding protein
VSQALLEVDELAAGYGGIPVVSGFDLTVNEGDIVALLGPNGAGKSTVLLSIVGLLPLVGGSIEVFGLPIGKLGPGGAARAGVAFVPADRALFTSMTTEENLDVVRRRGAMTTSEAIALFPKLEPLRSTRASLLSGGEQQMLAVARALINRPRLLLIDELSMGLAPEVVVSMLPVIRETARQAGAGVVLVEQHARLVLSIADSAAVIAYSGVFHAPAERLRSEPELLEQAYLGGAR